MARRPRKKIFLYVLRLQGDRYYVGQSTNPTERIKKHFDGEGSSWTRLHAPLEVVKTVALDTTSWLAATAIENTLTLELMQIFGAENVRGGAYSANNLSYDPDKHAKE